MPRSKYNVILNNKGESLVYYPCKKNANSSAKLFLVKHLGRENKIFFVEDDIPRYKEKLYKNQIKKYGNKVNLIKTFPTSQQFTKVTADFTCCIIRDPIKRFISAYRNRILYHKDKEFNNYTVDQVLRKLLEKKFENKHFLPQTFFLGNDLRYFSFYSDVANILSFQEKINDFFGKRIKFPKIQTGGKSFNIELTKKQISLVENIYETDFLLYLSRK